MISGRPDSRILPALCLCAAGVLQTYVMAGPRSTFICPISSSARTTVPLLQIVGVLIDCYVLVNLMTIVKAFNVDATSRNGFAVVLSSIFLVSNNTCKALG